jgi:hypothetical protein
LAGIFASALPAINDAANTANTNTVTARRPTNVLIIIVNTPVVFVLQFKFPSVRFVSIISSRNRSGLIPIIVSHYASPLFDV